MSGASRHLAVCGLLAAAGCSVYDSRYVFDPRPVDVAASKPGAEGSAPLRALVTVLGVRRADEHAKMPACIDVRLRIDNTSPFPATFDPKGLCLFSAGLDRFPEPVLSTQQHLELAPGTFAFVDACFAFPQGSRPAELDLSGLDVRWTVAIDGQPVTSSASFMRRPGGYYDRYYYRIGVGYQGYP